MRSVVCETHTHPPARVRRYRDEKMGVGPIINMHLAHFYKVNIYFITQRFFRGKGSEFVRVTSPYRPELNSVVLFHRCEAEMGHYESIQTKKGHGFFAHESGLVRTLRVVLDSQNPSWSQG